eukprot:14919-Heterococcus_DN1.PRE.5
MCAPSHSVHVDYASVEGHAAALLCITMPLTAFPVQQQCRLHTCCTALDDLRYAAVPDSL